MGLSDIASSLRGWLPSEAQSSCKLIANTAVAIGMLVCVCHAKALPPRLLVEVVDIGKPVVSPDGRYVAFRTEQASIERNNYDTVWYVQRMDGETQPLKVADGGIPLRNSAGSSLPAPATWSQDGAWIYYRAAINGRIDVWRAATDGSGAEPVTLDAADVRDFVLSSDGLLIRYSVGASRAEVAAAEQAEYDQGIRIDERVPLGSSLFRSANFGGRLATHRYTGNWFDHELLLADVPDRWKMIDLATRTTQDIGSAEIPSAPLDSSRFAHGGEVPWRWAPDLATGRIGLLTRTGKGEGLAQKPGVELSMLPEPSARRAVRCIAELCVRRPISGIQWRPGSDEILFTITDPDEGQAQSIFRWNVGAGEVHPVVYSSGLLGGGMDAYSECGVSAHAMACVASDANTPHQLERIDLMSGERRVIFMPNEALARERRNASAARMLRWTDSQGRKFTGQFIPADTVYGTPSPLFITYYSCPGFLRGGVGDEWPLASLATHGIATLCINQYREFPLDAVERYGIALSAIASAIDLLEGAGEIDRSRIGMGGLSFGTEVTMWTVVHSDLLIAASMSSPVLSPTYYLMGSMKGDDFVSELQRTWQVGAPGEPPGRWEVLSPAFNLDKIRSPLLLQMPEQEYLHATDYAIPLLRDHMADLYVFPHEPHLKFQPKHKLAAYTRNLDWFRFWLQGYEDGNVRKAEQYRHWHIMRKGVCELEREGAKPFYCKQS